MFTYLLNGLDENRKNLSSLRMGLSGGASLPVEVLKEWENRFKAEIIEVYGLTESAGLVTANPVYGTRKPGSIGITVSGVEARVVDKQGDELPRGAIGELIFKGPNATSGYLNPLSAFIVEKDRPGFTVHRRLKMMAPHDMAELKFEDCLIPRENLLGEIGQGFAIAMGTLDVFRMSVGAAAVGIGRTAFEASLNYAKKRIQFKNPIAKFQAIQLKLAEMATELDAARALLYRAAIRKDQGKGDVSWEAAMAKWYATETAFRVVDQGVQIHGGIGVMQGSVVERLYLMKRCPPPFCPVMSFCCWKMESRLWKC